MYAWLRHSKGSKADDKIVKYDIDLLDAQGNVCVQFSAFSTRDITTQTQNKTPNGEQGSLESGEFNESYYEDILERLLDNKISADEAVELG